MPTTIYFVRHGHVENKDGIIYGRLPGYRLSKQGREEAELAATYLANKNITQIYSSPLERCVETAEIIAEKVKITKIERLLGLTEVNAAKWEGQPWAHMIENPYYDKLINDPDTDKTDENLKDMAKRMVNATNKILDDHKGENIACISHEFPILALKLKLENKPLVTLKTLGIKTGGIVRFSFDEEGEFIDDASVSFPGI